MGNLADDHIQKAMDAGEFDNLSGAGKPLNLEADRLVPEENRLAYRIMRDNDIQPEWISLQKALDRDIQLAREELQRHAQDFKRVMTRLADKTDADSILGRLTARDQRDQAQANFREQVTQINRKLREFNLKVPFSHLTRDLLDAEREIRRAFPT